MNHKFLKVEGNDDLVRDLSSKAIINTNTDDLLKAKSAKQKRLKEKQEFDALKNDVADLKSMMQQILLKLDNK